ncbi:MAG: hypothetical protein QNL68_11025 [Akkermansiaceae bacterium]
MTISSEPLPLLFATVLLDPPGHRTARQLGKAQVSSLLRFFFNGEIIVWRNFPEILYPVGRVGVHEFDFVPSSPLKKDADLAEISLKAKLQLAESLVEHAHRYSWIILADHDVLALRNLDHLFENQDADLLVSQRKDGTFNEGFFAINSSHYSRFLEAWKAPKILPSRGAPHFLQAIIDTKEFSTKNFERGEIVSPFADDCPVRTIMEAAVVSLAGGTATEKTKLSFALHMMRTFGDEDGVFLDLMES